MKRYESNHIQNIQEIDPMVMEYLKEFFVTRRECDTITDDINNKLGRDYAELAVIKSQLKTITWILTAVGGGIITVIIKLFFGGV